MIDEFVVYDQFINMYLAELQKLTVFFGRVCDHSLRCTFVVGLPAEVNRLFYASPRIDELSIDQMFTRAWAILKDRSNAGDTD